MAEDGHCDWLLPSIPKGSLHFIHFTTYILNKCSWPTSVGMLLLHFFSQCFNSLKKELFEKFTSLHSEFRTLSPECVLQRKKKRKTSSSYRIRSWIFQNLNAMGMFPTHSSLTENESISASFFEKIISVSPEEVTQWFTLL